MSCTFGTLFQVTVFGESHSAGIGAVITGLPAGTPLDISRIEAAMMRRAPGIGAASTSRKESDRFEILSGFVSGRTTGTPLAAVIRNTDTRSQDYLRTADLMRPGHADYTGHVKYRGMGDIRGGGHFSGRITAPLVFAGACARQVLEERGMTIGAHVLRVADIADTPFSLFDPSELLEPESNPMRVLNRAAGDAMVTRIEAAKKEMDSLGGEIECAVVGVPAGLGEPFFDSVESELAHMMFSVPGIKGISFGDGFGMARMRGSEANDSPKMDAGRVVFSSNHSGGVNGGITNGMPVVFRLAVRPTASIAKAQETINVRTMEDAVLELHGRHDACIAPRAVEVIKSGAAIVLLDLLMREKAYLHE